MDKYQKMLLETEKASTFFSCTSKKNFTVLVGGFNYDEDIYVLTQEEDIFSTKYDFVIKANSNIEACAFLLNGEWQSVSRNETEFSIDLDFENRVEKIKLTFANNIVDDYTFSVQYVEADRELYYQKQEAELKASRLHSAHIWHATGADLVNIYFQPCCDDYKYTEIFLYVDQAYGTDQSLTWQFIKKWRVPAEDFYQSIGGLAYGRYSYVVKQFDKEDNLLLETDKTSFSFTRPNYNHHR